MQRSAAVPGGAHYPLRRTPAPRQGPPGSGDEPSDLHQPQGFVLVTSSQDDTAINKYFSPASRLVDQLAV